MTDTTTPHEGASEPVDPVEEAKNKKEFEAQQAERAREQNLPEGSVPEQRPIASQTVDDEQLHSGVYKKLREAEDDRAGAPAMPFSAYTKARSKEQMRKAAKESKQVTNHPNGTRAWINNPGEPDHGRAVAVNRVNEYASVEDERIAAAGNPNSRFAEVKSYECTSRDGRAELLIVSAEHLKIDTSGGADWGKTPLTMPL